MNLETLKELVREACKLHADSNQEEPSGAKMARTDLVAIAKDAQELVNMFGDDAKLDPWVEAKITKAADYLNSIKKHLGGEIVRQHGGLMEADWSDLEDDMSTPFDDVEPRDDDLQLPPERKMQKLAPSEYKAELPSVKELSKGLERVVGEMMGEKVLATLHFRKTELGDEKFNELYNLSNKTLNSLIYIRDELRDLGKQ